MKSSYYSHFRGEENRLIKVKQLDQGHTVSVLVSDLGFKLRLCAPEPCLTDHIRRTCGVWPGRLGSRAFQGERVTGTGPSGGRQPVAVEDPNGCMVGICVQCSRCEGSERVGGRVHSPSPCRPCPIWVL